METKHMSGLYHMFWEVTIVLVTVNIKLAVYRFITANSQTAEFHTINKVIWSYSVCSYLQI
jgi:hypothetical protein